jgi:hypothetical protein
MIYRVIAVFILLAFLAGCTDPVEPVEQAAEFGIFLLSNDTLNTNDVKHISLDELMLKENPLINIDDVVLYHWSDHTIDLTDDGFAKFKSVEGMVRSTYGLPFVVVVHGEKVYLGTIYPYYSSYIHPDLPYIGVSPFLSLTIERAADNRVADVRSDERVYNALRRRGKLIEREN